MNIFRCAFFIFLLTLLVQCDSSSSKKSNPDSGNISGEINLPENIWVRDENNPVVTAAEGSSITNICDPSVLFHDNRFKMWASCVEDDMTVASICYSESSDGSTWSAPVKVFTPSVSGTAWDNRKTEVPSVIVDENESDEGKRYKMWYGGAGSDNPDLTNIGYACSADGINWTRFPASDPDNDGLVLVPGFTEGDAGVVSDPAVIRKGETLYMWYNSFGINNDILISHASSADGAVWIKSSGNPVLRPDFEWETGGPGDITEDVSHPAVMFVSSVDKIIMWYGSFDSSDYETYSGLGYAESSDGVTWTRASNNPVFLPDTSKNGEEIGISTGPSVVYHDGRYHLFYCGANREGIRVINHATSL